ncbi:methyltransferase type 11 [Mangrovactinospora gilvigrisea]|uniref:Methyltransferase type 11 n=1 Tax=Mangrovactinospora gilvigrisea TaxID=1428644 RepID=A0A1J7C712_9ACTN|nr:class I SAM-dependent methyltransferase [Mangrovactinospora gilvigrisea]OIV37324.1 methyltransferase type 11 [Mangrovactinospora gilvigrisea]
MHRHEFLRTLHKVYRPRNYMEIGVNDGRSLALSRVPSIGVDPAFKVVKPIRCDVQLVKATSDDFFARKDPLAHFARSPLKIGPLRNRPRVRAALEKGPLKRGAVDLAFIDGMHLFEFALRDFINTEKYAQWSSVIVFDDMLPRNVPEAARDRHTDAWTGDVYKVIEVLRRYRPDLALVPIDSAPTGTLVVFGADPDNRVLEDAYDDIIKEFVYDDPQKVPSEVMDRTHAVKPMDLLDGELWAPLVRARDLGLGRGRGWPALRRRLEPFALKD